MHRAPLSPVITALGTAGAFIAFSIAESRRPLRRPREPRLRRHLRNIAVAGVTALITSAVQRVVLEPLMRRVETNRLGLLQRTNLGPVAQTVAGIVLLDYTLWWWHWLNHRKPLWRFHVVHHLDRDLDASTALRFHFGEMALSVFFRAAQLRLLGADRLTVSVWQLMLLVSILFHHSNTDVGESLDHALSRAVVTPRMHGIHHSVVADETDSNWSSLFSWWDFLHGTFREDVPHWRIDIGAPTHPDMGDVALGSALRLPFTSAATRL